MTVDRCAVVCEPLATPADLCCATEGPCVPDGTDPPSQQTMEAAIVDATEWVLDRTSGLPVAGPCSVTLEACATCGGCGVCGICASRHAQLVDLAPWLCGNPIRAVTWTAASGAVLSSDPGVDEGTIEVVDGTKIRPADTYWPYGVAQIEVSYGLDLADPYDTPDGRTLPRVPVFVRWAVADLACFMIQRCLPADRCTFDLPDNTEGLSQAGATVRLVTTIDLHTAGMVGIRSVDEVLARYSDRSERSTISMFTDPAAPAAAMRIVELS